MSDGLNDSNPPRDARIPAPEWLKTVTPNVSPHRPLEASLGTRLGRFADLGMELGELCDKKNAAYGNSAEVAGAILKLLYPSGVQPHQYKEMLLVVRMLDKLCRIAQGAGGARALGEDAWRDLVGYSLIGVMMTKEGR